MLVLTRGKQLNIPTLPISFQHRPAAMLTPFRLPQAFNQVAELRKIVAAAARRLELGDLSSELDGAGRQDEQDASRASRSLVPARAHAPQRYGNRAGIPRSCSLGSPAAECVHCRKCGA